MRELAHDIVDLEYQVPFVLSIKPRVTIRIDFAYRKWDTGVRDFDKVKTYDEVKGAMTKDARVKLAWLKEKGISVNIVRSEDGVCSTSAE